MFIEWLGGSSGSFFGPQSSVRRLWCWQQPWGGRQACTLQPTGAFAAGQRWEMTTANAIAAGRAGEGQQGTSRMFYLFVPSHGQPIVSLSLPVPRPCHTRCTPDCSNARPLGGKVLGFFSLPFVVSALPGQALPLCLSTKLLPCAAFPARSLAPRPHAQPNPFMLLHLELRILFPSINLVLQRRVVFLLEKDPTEPSQIVILGHVLHRIPIFLSLDTLLPWDLFLKHSPKEKHLC